MCAHHQEVLLGDGRPKASEAFKHTARGLEAIGFNAQASMYHVDREYSPDSDDEERANKKKSKQKTSFLKKLVGGGKEKGEKI